MAVLALQTPEDRLLGAMAPLGLAVAAPGTALVVDLDPNGAPYPGVRSLASLVEEGPRRSDLTPTTEGVAVIGNGGVTFATAREVVDHLATGWPHLVLRLPPRLVVPWPTVSVVPLLPGGLTAPAQQLVAYQDAGWRVAAPGPGVVLPRPRRATWVELAAGRRPFADRWIRRMGALWSWT